MANVLPQENQKQQRRRMAARYMFAFSLVALAGGGIAFLAFLPSYITLAIGGSRLQNDAAPATSSVSILVRDTKTLITHLKPLVSATTTPSALIGIVASAKPANLSLKSITYSPGKIVVTGTAASSTAIEAFRGTLERSKQFTSVTIPVSALVGSANRSFSITLAGTF